MRRPSPSASAHQELGLNFLPLPPLLSECFPGLYWGQRRSPPAPGPVLLREPVQIICCFGSTALGRNRRQLWGGRRGKLCLSEGSSVLWDPAGAAPSNRCFTCCGMPGEGGIACTCPQGRRELCGGCLQKAWGRASLLLRRKLGQSDVLENPISCACPRRLQPVAQVWLRACVLGVYSASIASEDKGTLILYCPPSPFEAPSGAAALAPFAPPAPVTPGLLPQGSAERLRWARALSPGCGEGALLVPGNCRGPCPRASSSGRRGESVTHAVIASVLAPRVNTVSLAQG